MSSLRAQRGAAAERLAADYLAARGLELLAHNVRCKAGELDLVCRHAEVLAFIEVRQRASAHFGGAAASVTLAKQRKLIKAARHFVNCNPRWRSCVMRFDVLAVNGLPEGEHLIEWIKDAFR